ncbi:helix-turn-helix transcriptional regulator [Chryseobacterium sp. MHB01]|uniref:helix-turn-helix domain-containing protein n=1 Tax=Chryseobacterium sp. MHB01 TaxID=3109433 RepID=UPI002B002282|nr:helix-turn-helix transcriptional regulator [Chryseobacterium sp. MHB01]MEA1850776.1 helix-turn-helix transcriptional regulator [Chryseobacterium sp. MHB01]
MYKFVKTDLNMGVGTNLKKLRSKTKLSQQEIADMLGLDRNTYTNWENEATDIKSSYIPKLAEIFEVSIVDLFESGNKQSNYNNLENAELKDNSIGQKDIQQGIIINITDSEAAKVISMQLEELIKSLKK